MAGNHQQEGLGDEFFEQILAVPPGYGGGGGGGEIGGSTMSMALQLGSGGGGGGVGGGDSGLREMGMGMMMMPLGLNLEHHGFLRQQDHHDSSSIISVDLNHNSNLNNNNNITHNNSHSSSTSIHERDMPGFFPVFGQMQTQPLRPPPPQPQPQPQNFNSQPRATPQPTPPFIRPRVRARRGQATDPHSIAERLRRERIAERMRALQELVPSCNKTDRAAMLDEIVDYVRFLRLQVKILSMSRLGAATAVAQLVADVPLSSVEGGEIDGEAAWEKWSNDGTEHRIAKLMEEDIGAAMQLLQSKSLCIMPITLASAIFRTHQPDSLSLLKPESTNHHLA